MNIGFSIRLLFCIQLSARTLVLVFKSCWGFCFDLWRLYSISVWTLGGFWSFGWTFRAWTFAWTFVLAFNFFLRLSSAFAWTFVVVFQFCLDFCWFFIFCLDWFWFPALASTLNSALDEIFQNLMQISSALTMELLPSLLISSQKEKLSHSHQKSVYVAPFFGGQVDMKRNDAKKLMDYAIQSRKR